MGSIAFVVGSAIVNGLAFSASNYLFSGMSEDDRKRHDLAVEKLQKAQEEYDKKRIERMDYQSQVLANQRHANQQFGESMEAIKQYNEFTRRPVLSDFYEPSPKQKSMELVWIVTGTGLVYYLTKKYYH